MFKKLLVIAAIMLLSGAMVYALPNETVTVTVTPSGDVSISLDQATVAFGTLDVNTSSASATAVTITNNGAIGCKLSKGVTTDAANWTISDSSSTEDGYDLFIGTAVSQPTIADFEAGHADLQITATGASSKFITGIGSGNTQVTLSPTGTCKTWFMIRMPKTVSVPGNQEQTITVTYTAESN